MSAKSIFTSAILGALLMAAIIQFACGATVAIDDASQLPYTDGWQAGDNGGSGFGPWSFAFSGDGIGLIHPPQFVDNGPLPGNSLGAPAFALSTGDRPYFTDTSEVQRNFVAPLGIGQTFSADLDGSDLNPSAIGFTIGNTFDLYGTNGTERFSLFTNNQYHSDHWTATGDADTAIPAGSSFHIDFKLVTTDSYDLRLSPIGGGAPYFTQTGVSLAGTSGLAINRLRISDYGTGSSTDGGKEFFFDNLVVSGPIPGDFNNDNVVDAADYVFWRKNGLDANSYDLWRVHFGQMASGNALLTGPSQFVVPEPKSAMLSFMILIALRRKHRKQFCRGVRYASLCCQDETSRRNAT
jgi:hypothetical protein